MRYLLAILILAFLSCSNNETPIENSETQSTTEQLHDSLPTYPSTYSLDSSWRVSLDIQEGFFISYTITYPPGNDTTIMADNNIPVIGGMDYPSPLYINNTTYFVPNIGGSSLGHFELYIYKNGSCKYVEKISDSLTATVIDSIKNERINPTPTIYHPVIKSTYSLHNNTLSFRRKATYYPNKHSPDSSSSHTLRFKLNNNPSQFTISGDSLTLIDFYYSETTPLHYAYGNKPYEGYIKGSKQKDNSWLLEIDFWLNLKSDTSKNKQEKHIQFTESFITYGNSTRK